MFDTIKSMLGLAPDADKAATPRAIDRNLAAAALMVHVIAADGTIDPEEEERLRLILHTHYNLDRKEADALATEARATHDEAVDLYAFTSVLKREMNDDDRMLLVEDLWEMVYADGELHEFEDNVVWRVAELLGVQTQQRILLKQRVKERHGQSATDSITAAMNRLSDD